MIERPAGLRWRERDESRVVLAPSWRHAWVSAGLLVLNGGVIALTLTHPSRGKSVPWYLLVYLTLAMASLVASVFYPWWGGRELAFADGLFRVRRGKRALLELAVRDLKQFAAEPTDDGFRVVAVKVDDERRELDLPIGSPLWMSNSPRGKELRRTAGRSEAEFIALRLGEMLALARQSTGSYRG